MPTLNIAHRGGAALMPENTLAAFQNAIALGADGAELDVQLSADGVVVVHHDPRLNPGYCRDAGGRWLNGQTPRIKDLRFAELQRFDIGRPAPDSDYAYTHPVLAPVDGARIPSLVEVLAIAAAAPQPFVLFVELKSDTSDDSADPIALADAALAACGGHLDQVIFVGFDWRGLLRVRQTAPGARCWFTTDKLRGDYLPMLDAIKAAGGDGWFPHHGDATGLAISDAHARGLKVGAWTVNESAEMKKMTAQGIDAICTDRPDLLQWSYNGRFYERTSAMRKKFHVAMFCSRASHAEKKIFYREIFGEPSSEGLINEGDDGREYFATIWAGRRDVCFALIIKPELSGPQEQLSHFGYIFDDAAEFDAEIQRRNVNRKKIKTYPGGQRQTFIKIEDGPVVECELLFNSQAFE